MTPTLHWYRLGWLMLFGATIGAFLDWTHTDGHAIEYPEGTNHWRGVVTFTIAYAIPGLMYTLYMRATEAPPPVDFRTAMKWTLFYGLNYMFTAYGTSVFSVDPNTIFVILMTNGLIAWGWLDGSWQGVFGAVATAVVGCAIEHHLCEEDLMSYVTPQYGRVPYWLFGVYFLSANSWGHACRRVLTSTDALYDFSALRI